MKQLETDYLVIGTGAIGMTFVDTMLDESEANFIMVDKHHMPGGHWNDAYPFVRLHQPSSFYGVSSTELGSNRIDDSGSNKGFYELASGPEISAYFEKIMRERFLPSGRVQYFPMHEYKGNHQFQALLSDQQYSVKVNKKVVDATFFKTTVPSMHQRRFTVEEGVICIPPNDLPRLAPNYQHFTVLGGGKTAMDTCVWLLDNGANPDAITWICPRDSWLINRATTQPGADFFVQSTGSFAKSIEAMRDATSVEDLFERLEADGSMVRIDPTMTPKMFHYATISTGELEQLRRIKHVIRGKRVAHLEAERMVMVDGGEETAVSQTLYIDCTARAVELEEMTTTVFTPGLITLQVVFAPLLTYSAAIIAYAEANFETDKEKNEVCPPVTLADTPEEWMASSVGNLMNTFIWSQNKEMGRWTSTNRLNPGSAAIKEGAGRSPEHREIIGRIRQNVLPAVMNLRRLIEELPST